MRIALTSVVGSKRNHPRRASIVFGDHQGTQPLRFQPAHNPDRRLRVRVVADAHPVPGPLGGDGRCRKKSIKPLATQPRDHLRRHLAVFEGRHLNRKFTARRLRPGSRCRLR